MPAGLAGLWCALRTSTVLGSVVRGQVFGLAYLGVSLSWLNTSIGTSAWLALTAVGAILMTAGVVLMRFVAPLALGPLWGAALWMVAETMRSTWPLGGLPWARTGFAALDTAWSGLLPYLGIPGTGFLIAAGAFAAAEIAMRVLGLVERDSTRPSLAVLILVVGLVGAAWWRPVAPASTGSLRVAVVQGGVPGDGTELARFHRAVTRNHAEATVDLAARLDGSGESVDLVVWPENSTAVDPIADMTAHSLIDTAAQRVGAPVLVGGIFDGRDAATAYNRGLLWPTDGHPAVRRDEVTYTKRHLVPFGEYIPWRSVIGSWSPRFKLIPRDMLPGTPSVPLALGNIPFAAAICFDVAYDDVVPDQVMQGARFVTVQTSNATFFGTAQPDQQLAITRSRAIESGRAVVVASTNGVSAVIDWNGNVVEMLPRGETATTVSDLQLSTTITPAVRWRVLQRPTILVFGAAGLALSLRRLLLRRGHLDRR